MTRSSNSPTDAGLLLPGLDGSNPLAFLAALGTLRSLTLAWPEREIRMAWVKQLGGWRPSISSKTPLDMEEVVTTLDTRLKQMADCPALAFAKNLSVTGAEFRSFAESVMQNISAANRIAADFAAAFACDAVVTEQGIVKDTALRTMSGAGHQHFLAFMRHIVEATGPDHLRKTLFAPWSYDDAVANQTLRWDPADDSRYALQWRDPSGDPTRKIRGGMLGANRLAIEGLPLVTCAPVGSNLKTTGFIGSGARDTFWTWPLWTRPVSLDLCRSVLAHAALLDDAQDDIRQLRAMGVAAAFRSQRITVGKFRNFTPAVAVF